MIYLIIYQIVKNYYLINKLKLIKYQMIADRSFIVTIYKHYKTIIIKTDI